jgi:3-oxoadipate enol-lactonase
MPFSSNTPLRMYYEERGEGRPVLYISGTGADLRVKPNVLDSPITQHLRVLTYDQRGLGQSDIPAGPYTMAEYADDAFELLQEKGWPKVHVIGVSFGGMVALNLAVRHPQVIDRLVLCCTSPGGAAPSYPLHSVATDLSDEARVRFMLEINDSRRDEAWQKNHPDKVQKAIDYTLAARKNLPSDAQSRLGAQRQLAARADHDVLALLSQIQHTTLICAGRYDGIAPKNNQNLMADAMPQAELAWFEGGHLFMIQDKTAWPTIIEFLTSTRG